MTKHLILLTALMLIAGCGNDPVDHNAQPDTDTEQPDADTVPTWVTDKTYAGLEWSPVSENMMGWEEAMDYCEAMDARLPTINELRKIITNSPGSTYGGACQVSDPDCLSSDDCWSGDCLGSETADSYSALGDGKDIYLWSSSCDIDSAYNAWIVSFYFGDLTNSVKGVTHHVRCVR